MIFSGHWSSHQNNGHSDASPGSPSRAEVLAFPARRNVGYRWLTAKSPVRSESCSHRRELPHPRWCLLGAVCSVLTVSGLRGGPLAWPLASIQDNWRASQLRSFLWDGLRPMWQPFHSSAFPSVQPYSLHSFTLVIPRVWPTKTPAHKSPPQCLLFRQPNLRYRVDGFP